MVLRSDAVALRFSAFAAATLLVLALTAAALLTRFAWSVREPAPEVQIVSSWPAQPQGAAAAAAGRRAATSGAAPAAAIETMAPGDAAVPGALFRSLRCATAEGRRAHPELCAGDASFAAQGAGDIAPTRVDGVRTREGAAQRSILRNMQRGVETYARGEAQRYADPRQDPIYEEGTDPATAAHRPCPEGQAPVGDGRGLNGQTCRPR